MYTYTHIQMHTHKYTYIHVGSPIQTYLHKQTYIYKYRNCKKSLLSLYNLYEDTDEYILTK